MENGVGGNWKVSKVHYFAHFLLSLVQPRTTDVHEPDVLCSSLNSNGPPQPGWFESLCFRFTLFPAFLSLLFPLPQIALSVEHPRKKKQHNDPSLLASRLHRVSLQPKPETFPSLFFSADEHFSMVERKKRKRRDRRHTRERPGRRRAALQ